MNRQEKHELMAQCRAERRKNVLRIRGVLLFNGHTISTFAEAEGLTLQAVSNTLNGLNNSTSVLDALIKHHVPVEYLADPRQVRRNAK